MKPAKSAIGYQNFQFWVPSGQSATESIRDNWHLTLLASSAWFLAAGLSSDQRFFVAVTRLIGSYWEQCLRSVITDIRHFSATGRMPLRVPADINVFSRRFIFWLVNVCRPFILFPIKKPHYQPAQGYFTGHDIITSLSEFHWDIAILFNLWIRFFYAPQRAQRTQRRRKEGMF